VDIQHAREFVRSNHRTVLCTRRRDGGVQLSPVLSNADPEGRIEISSNEPRAKVRNIRRDPRVSLCVTNDRFFGSWVQMDGTAEVLSLPEALEPLVEYYRRLSGEHEDWDEYRRSMVAEQRCLLKITLQRATGR
jgi:PPOX class probable F420-dependent enzyme